MSKTNKTAKAEPSGSGAERRRSKRMDVLDTFSLYAVVPAKGPLRLKVHDISDLGMGFDLDIEEEKGAANFPVKTGQSFDIHLYLNQSLYVPLTVQIRRIVDEGGIRRIGAEFGAKGSKGHTALVAFLDMLDVLGEVARIEN